MKTLSEFFKIAALTSMVTMGSAQAEPYINATNPDGKRVKVDCGELIITPKNKKGKTGLRMSCDFAEQLNPDGRNLCSDTDNTPKLLSKELMAKEKRNIAQATNRIISHFGASHGDCVSVAAVFYTKLKRGTYLDRGMETSEAQTKAEENVDSFFGNKYGDDWKSKKSCTLKNAVKACRVEMGLD